MEFTFRDCWDCPIPLIWALVYACGGICTAALSVLWWRSSTLWLRVLSGIVAFLSLIWYGLMTIGIFRFGIQWLPRWEFVRPADAGFVAAWYAISLFVLFAVRKLTARK